MKLKIIAAILVFVMVLPVLIGCHETVSPSINTTSATSESTSVAETVDEEKLLYESLPEADYEGYTFKVLNLTSNFAITTFTAESITGDVIGDAVYKRNLAVEQRLNVIIEAEEMSYKNIVSTIQTQVSSNDNIYDIAYDESWEMVALASKGCLCEADKLSLNLDNPWWNSYANESLRVGDNLYMIVGDLHTMFWESMWCVAFNKDIVTNSNLDDIYSLVENKQWTFDKMAEMINDGSADLDGDGLMGENDCFGATTYCSGVYSPFITSCGLQLVTLNDDGTYNTDKSDKLLSVCESITNTFYSNSNVYNSGVSSKIVDNFNVLFKNGNALFEIEVVGGVKDLRMTNINYGIVPVPMYDESQDNYISLIAQYAAAMGIPTTSPDLERTSTILECLAAYSRKEIRPAYYDNLLTTRSVSDIQSSNMLDIIFSNGSFEMDLVLLKGVGYSNVIYNEMKIGGTNFSSKISASTTSINRNLEVVIASLEKYGH